MQCLCWCLLAEIFDCNRAILIYSSWGSDPRTCSAWAVIEGESDQAITRLGEVQDILRCCRKQCQRFCGLKGFFSPYLDQMDDHAMGRAHRDLTQALFWLSNMPGSATRFSCRLMNPGTCTSSFYNSRLTYIPGFLFSVQKARETK